MNLFKDQQGIAFLTVVLILGIFTITAGTGVTVYKISQGMKPSLDIQIKIKEGTAKLKVDPEIGASLESEDLYVNEFALGTFNGGNAYNEFLVLDETAPPPLGFQKVDNVTYDSSIGNGKALINLKQELDFSASIIDPSLPFAFNGEYKFITNITEGNITDTHNFFAEVGADDILGMYLKNSDSDYFYSKQSEYSLIGQGIMDLGNYELTTGENLIWDMAGNYPFLKAELTVVPEPSTWLLLFFGILGIVGIKKKIR